MAKFLYEASDEGGVIVTGEFEALDKGDVIRHLEARKLIPINVRELGEGKRSLSLSSSFFERVTALDRIMMVRNLSAAIKAGLSIIEALDIMIVDAEKKVLKEILISAKSSLENGQPLWKTFESYGDLFPIVFVGMVKAGEASGELDKTLDELSNHLAREYTLAGKIKSALMYPVVLLGAAVAVVILLLIFVLPRLSRTFESSGVELPFITKLLINVSNIVTFNWFVDGAVIIFLLWFFLYFRKTSKGRRFFSWAFFRIPVAKELVKKVALVRFTRTLASLIKSGTPMLEALNLSADSVGNATYKKVIIESIKKVKSGIPLSNSLEVYPALFPRFLVGLMAVGEKTGTLDHTLSTFSGFYDEEIDNTLKTLMSLIEPILIVSMGLIVALIAIAVLLPIYRLASGFL